MDQFPKALIIEVQKIIEESPAPKVQDSIIKEMADKAVKFASDQKYEGAGTIEFIYDIDQKRFYFLFEVFELLLLYHQQLYIFLHLYKMVP